MERVWLCFDAVDVVVLSFDLLVCVVWWGCCILGVCPWWICFGAGFLCVCFVGLVWQFVWELLV